MIWSPNPCSLVPQVLCEWYQEGRNVGTWLNYAIYRQAFGEQLDCSRSLRWSPHDWVMVILKQRKSERKGVPERQACSLSPALCCRPCPQDSPAGKSLYEAPRLCKSRSVYWYKLLFMDSLFYVGCCSQKQLSSTASIQPDSANLGITITTPTSAWHSKSSLHPAQRIGKSAV